MSSAPITPTGTDRHWLKIALFLALPLLTLYHLHLLSVPFPLESRENAPVLITRLLLTGGNPYAFEEMPLYSNAYGPIYNLVVLPFARVLGASLATHRLVSGLALAGACILLYLACRRLGATKFPAAVAATAWWAHLLVGTTPLARVDAVGLLLFSTAFTFPLSLNFSARSYALAAAAAITAFFAKQYFFTIIVGLTLSALLIRGIGFATIFAVTASTCSIAAVVLVSFFLPTFIENALLIGWRAYVRDLDFLLTEVLLWARENAFLLFLVLVAAFTDRHRRFTSFFALVRTSIDFDGWCQTLSGFAITRLSSWGRRNYHLVLGISMLPFTLKASSHPGNVFVYSAQLMTPFLLMVAARAASGSGTWRPALLALHLIVAMTALPLRELPGERTAWAAWRSTLEPSRLPLLPAELSLVADDLGKPIRDTGLSAYWEFALLKLTPANAREVERYRALLTAQADDLRLGHHDIIVAAPSSTLARQAENGDYHLTPPLFLPEPPLNPRRWNLSHRMRAINVYVHN